MKSRKRWIILVFVLVTFGCSPLTSGALVELSRHEGEFYGKLQPALVEAKDTFRVTANALITGTASRKAAAMRREATAERQTIYQSLAASNPPQETVEKAIGRLVSMNAAVDAMVDKQTEAAKTRVEAIAKTFDALDATLGRIRENHQVLQGHLGARRHIFARPGSPAFVSFKTSAETRDRLSQSVKSLEDQFKLAGELVEAAREEFDEQHKRHKP